MKPPMRKVEESPMIDHPSRASSRPGAETTRLKPKSIEAETSTIRPYMNSPG